MSYTPASVECEKQMAWICLMVKMKNQYLGNKFEKLTKYRAAIKNLPISDELNTALEKELGLNPRRNKYEYWP